MQDERFISLESAFKAFGKKIKDTTSNIKPGSAQSDFLTVTLEHLQDKDCVLYFAYNRMNLNVRQEFQAAIQEQYKSASYMLLYQLKNFAFGDHYTSKQVVDITLSKKFEDMKCIGCSTSTLLGSLCCPACDHSICNSCLNKYDYKCPTCNTAIVTMNK